MPNWARIREKDNFGTWSKLIISLHRCTRGSRIWTFVKRKSRLSLSQNNKLRNVYKTHTYATWLPIEILLSASMLRALKSITLYQPLDYSTFSFFSFFSFSYIKHLTPHSVKFREMIKSCRTDSFEWCLKNFFLKTDPSEMSPTLNWGGCLLFTLSRGKKSIPT